MGSHPCARRVVSHRLWDVFLSGGLLLSLLCTLSAAQITLDGSLGVKGRLTGPHYRIPAEVGQIRGPNLFQSWLMLDSGVLHTP